MHRVQALINNKIKSSPTKYFLPEEYQCNAPVTLDREEASAYWTPERVALSNQYQHHVYLLAAQMIARFGYQTAMDIGCGPATKSRMLLGAGIEKLVLIDQASSENMVRATVPNAEFIPIDLETLECQGNHIEVSRQFDIILCADVIEHLSDPYPCLNFILTHLKATGIAIFSTPERDILRGEGCMFSPNPAHVCEWTRNEFAKLLTSTGYTIHQHLNLPPRRLATLEEYVRMVVHPFFCLSRWHACQVAVCSKMLEGF